MSLTSNRVAEKLIAFGPVGFFLALISGHDGHLSKIPLAIGGLVGMLGIVLKLTRHRTKEEAL